MIAAGDISRIEVILKMIKNESQPKPGSTSSALTDECAQSDAILALGRKLVDELGLEPSVDTLGRWMAHHIADLITRNDGAAGEEKCATEKACFDAILALWKHRAELPNGSRPFEELEPVIRAVESLDPEDDTPRYFRSVHSPQRQGKEKSEVDQWLEMVRGLDYSAKILIGYCLGEAARAAVDKSEEWVKLAEAAGAEDGSAEIVLRFISSNADLGNKPDPNVEIRRQLQNRIERLEDFARLAEAVAGDLRAQLKTLPAPSKEADRKG